MGSCNALSFALPWMRVGFHLFMCIPTQKTKRAQSFFPFWNRYHIFSKAVYAKLKGSTGSPKQCEITLSFLYFDTFDGPGLTPFVNSGAEAFEAGINAISKYGGASAGYRTMLDALIPASRVLHEVIDNTYDAVFSLCYGRVHCMITLFLKISPSTEVGCRRGSHNCVCSLI